MYKIASGSTHDLTDTTNFVALLDTLAATSHGALAGFFNATADVIVTRAPGRLDLMGGIADYSGALVLQLPIANAAHVALQRHEQATLRLVSLPANPDEQPRLFEMSLAGFRNDAGAIDYSAACGRFKREPQHSWAAYVAGAFLVLMRERGQVFDTGASLLVSSAVPEGKGVSSSAALEVATMQALTAAYEIDVSPRELAFLCQRVENLVAGAPCGVMDQMTAVCGEAERLLALLCQPGEVQGTVQLPADLAVWGIDSGIRHAVSGEDYGTVRTAAFMGYRIIADLTGLQVRAGTRTGHVVVDDPKWHGYLANITPTEFEQVYAAHLPARMSGSEFLARYQGITDAITSVNPARKYPVRQATQHPICEHMRVNAFAAMLKDWRDLSQAEALGDLMCRSHRSYTACGLGSPGTDELVRLVREVGAASGLYGAKITGGGSGGTVAVLGRRDAGAAVEQVAAEYVRRTGHKPFIISGSSPGAHVFGHLRLRHEA